ncbi:unnamed protein product [Nezara viridula]|uniref:Lipase n=1 Tax=Nezara viridula TaxID=85310 RepID=A0A9P0MSP6_NEZVI|nr:unnamed protein product [Nezara viridula]
MVLSAILPLLLCFSTVECARQRKPPTTFGLQNIDQLAAKGNYSVTNYEVITEDGYSLWIFRIGNNTGPPVLMQHGIMVAADQWITRGPKRDLAFMLLEEGFDVWLSNQRGTIFNQRHLKYSKFDPRFWNFSFHESGYYDISAVIDFILAIRGKEKLFYIGHSLGTTVFLVMASTRPEYNDKIRAAVLLSPIAYPPDLDEMTPPLQLAIKNADFLYFILSLTGQLEFGHRNAFNVFALREFCTRLNFLREICLDIAMDAAGEHRSNLDKEEWDNFLPFYGAGTSLKTLRHIGQVYASGEFKQFDYGKRMNLKKYGNPRPPDYPLDRVTAPVAMYWGYNDPLLSVKSVEKLLSALPNVLYSKPVDDPLFNHIDMCLGNNSNIVLFPDIINQLKSLSV